MELNIFVCAKYVPESTEVNRIDPATRRLVREGVPKELDTAAASALEEGLRLAEQQGGHVTVVTMGPPEAEEGLRRALAIGAHDAVLVSDPLLAGSDALGTARVLAAVLQGRPFDLVLCATESTDSYTGLVPGMLAELLGMPQLTFAKQIEIRGGEVLIRRQAERGYQALQAPLPVLVTVSSGINEPRYPTLRSTLAAKKKEIQTVSAADLALGPTDVGEAGAREKVLAVRRPPSRPKGEIVVDEGDGGKRIADFLARIKMV